MNKIEEALEFVNYEILETETLLKESDNTGYDITTQANYVMGLKNKLESLKIVKQALEEKPTADVEKALECVEDLIFNFSVDEYVERYDKNLETIKQALQSKSLAERCWEIVKNKQVDLGWLWYCIHECVNSLNEYNKKMPIEKFKLTEAEFQTLKEGLEC